jgi:simple sugar transport system permease protein
VSSRANLLTTLASIFVAWLAFDLLVWAYGESPRELAVLVFEGTWGTAYGAGQVLFKATPLLFTGVAVQLALRAGLFNIGAEGQLTIGSLVAAVFAARISPAVPPVVAIPLVVLVAMAAGALWAAIPALLRARFGAHEVISTIMMNRIADATVGLAFASGLALVGTIRTAEIRDAAKLPRLEAVFSAFHGSGVSVAIVFAAVTALLMLAWQRRSRLGREMALVGENATACAAEGIPVARRLVLALLLSGAIAALGSTGTVLGYKGYYEQGLGAGAGFGGIAVALLGRNSALGLLFAALLFGTLAQGGLAINAHVPMEVMDVLQAIVIVAVAFGDIRIRSQIARELARLRRGKEAAA